MAADLRCIEDIIQLSASIRDTIQSSNNPYLTPAYKATNVSLRSFHYALIEARVLIHSCEEAKELDSLHYTLQNVVERGGRCLRILQNQMNAILNGRDGKRWIPNVPTSSEIEILYDLRGEIDTYCSSLNKELLFAGMWVSARQRIAPS